MPFQCWASVEDGGPTLKQIIMSLICWVDLGRFNHLVSSAAYDRFKVAHLDYI